MSIIRATGIQRFNQKPYNRAWSFDHANFPFVAVSKSAPDMTARQTAIFGMSRLPKDFYSPEAHSACRSQIYFSPAELSQKSEELEVYYMQLYYSFKVIFPSLYSDIDFRNEVILKAITRATTLATISDVGRPTGKAPVPDVVDVVSKYLMKQLDYYDPLWISWQRGNAEIVPQKEVFEFIIKHNLLRLPFSISIHFDSLDLAAKTAVGSLVIPFGLFLGSIGGIVPGSWHAGFEDMPLIPICAGAAVYSGSFLLKFVEAIGDLRYLKQNPQKLPVALGGK